MTAPITAAAHTQPAPEFPKKSYLNDGTTIRSWLLTHDHKRIGIMYLVSTILGLFLGGIFAMVLRLELLTPGPTIIEALTYNRMFTLHGLIMIFVFMIPVIPGVFGNFFLPIMLGAKDVAFPKWNLTSWYIYMFGSALMIWGLITGGADTGWTFYAPYSTTTTTNITRCCWGCSSSGSARS